MQAALCVKPMVEKVGAVWPVTVVAVTVGAEENPISVGVASGGRQLPPVLGATRIVSWSPTNHPVFCPAKPKDRFPADWLFRPAPTEGVVAALRPMVVPPTMVALEVADEAGLIDAPAVPVPVAPGVTVTGPLAAEPVGE